MSFRYLIESSGKTRYQLAKEAGMSHGAFARYYDGLSSPSNMSLVAAKRLAKALDISLQEFWENIKTPFQDLEFKEGWNEVDDRLSILVEEDGSIKRGILDDTKPVYPYEMEKDGTLTIVLNLTVKDLKNGKVVYFR